MREHKIFALALSAGLAREWINAKGQPMRVPEDTMRRILQALGLPCATDADCEESQRRLDALTCSDRLPPLLTGTVGQSVQLPPVRTLAGHAWRIELESGGALDGRFSDAPADLRLPPIAAAGYHHLHAGEASVTLAIAPPRCFGVADALAHRFGRVPDRKARLWGLGVQLYSLRRPGDGGFGDYSALATLAASLAGQGASALAISPVHAMFSADVQRFSPYGPSSRLFLNVLHIDPAQVLGRDALAAAIREEDAAAEMERLESLDLIDWPAAGALKLRLLRRLYRQFASLGDSEAMREFEDFRARQGAALRDHARFEAIHAHRLAHGESGDWRDWPQGLRDPAGAEVERFAHEHADDVRFHEFLQWQAARGLSGAQQAACAAGMPIGLIADLAVGADNGGSQAWSRQAEIINGLSVGAPPDLLNTRGQSWGLGAFSPHAMVARGFAAYIEMLRATFAYAGGARIDHVLGLSRLWLVPHGMSAEDGAYLRYPLQDLLRLIALESWRHRAIVIGEDLGTVQPGFDKILADAGLLGIRVLLFQQEGARFLRPDEWSPHAIATTTTHDLPTVAGWWQGRDIDWRHELDLLEQGQTEGDARAHRDRERQAMWRAFADAGTAQAEMPQASGQAAPLDEAAAFIADTPAPLAMLPIEDAIGQIEQPNLPGTTDQHPNWRRRLPDSAENLLQQERAAARIARLNRDRDYRSDDEGAN